MKRTTLTLMLLGGLWSGAGQAQGPATAESLAFIDMMNRYLEISQQVVNIASSNEASVHLALEGITEIYEQRRDGPAAEKHLRKLLEDYGSNQTVRNLIHFKLRDIYKETGQPEKALAELEAIIAENTR